MSGTYCSGIVSSAADVLGKSVVCGMREVGGMCMCLAQGGVGGEVGEWIRRFGLGFHNLVGTGECWMCGWWCVVDLGLCL